jgi:lysozyme
MTTLSARGAHFISRYEGWRDAPYNDQAGHATIGFGHLIHYGPVTAHDRAEWGRITQARGIQLLENDASVAEAAIDRYITRPLSQCERDALASFAFNCGGGALSGSVGRAVNAGRDPTSALGQWVHAGAAVSAGLVTRRKAEALLFTAGDYADGQPPAPPSEPDPQPPQRARRGTEVPARVPAWAWQWVEWKLGRGAFKGQAGDPARRAETGAPTPIPPWAWTFLKRFQ